MLSHSSIRQEALFQLRQALACKKRKRAARRGNILVLVAILLPAIVAVIGLVLDGGLLTARRRELQHACDAAATAAAREFYLTGNALAARQAAFDYIQEHNGIADAEITVNHPPLEGVYGGNTGFFEVVATRPCGTYLAHLMGGSSTRQVAARGVAGSTAATAGAAIVVLDENPHALTVNMPANLLSLLPAGVLSLLPSAPSLIGGLECLGLGQARVDGAVLVNTQWGGVDENNQPAGILSPLQYGVSCTPLLSLSKLAARDLRVSGGVDNLQNYENFSSGGPSPVQAGALPVPDPLSSIPVPSVAVDPTNVRSTIYGSRSVADTSNLQSLINLLGMQTVLNLLGLSQPYQPGVYSSIHVTSLLLPVRFAPGVYIIRGGGPVNLPPLILAGNVQAEGVMFYLTDNASFVATGGTADALDDETSLPPPQATLLLPSAVIVPMLGSRFSPLNDSGSPYHGMLLFQRRNDRRPIVLAQVDLPVLGGNTISGTLYAKWGHVILAGLGTYNVRLVAGTIRLLAVLDLLIDPTDLLPPAEDIFLVE